MHDILIVGAGISGLMAASRLAGVGLRICILDKGRTVGGRLATRRIGPGRADHGAQFFTARSTAFRQQVAAWEKEGLVYPWSFGWSDGSLAGPAADGHPRYAVRGGMNALAKALAGSLAAAGVALACGAQVVAVVHEDGAWSAVTADGARHQGRSCILALPVPQALALLEAGGVALASSQRAELVRVRYAPCLCGLFQVEGETLLPAPGALQRPEATIGWMADNRAKGISPEATTVTLHAAPGWSEQHYGDAEGELLLFFRAELTPWLPAGRAILQGEVKRWRYALPTVLHPAPFLRATGLPPLYFGGDAFGSPRVEGAVLSGLAIGDDLLRHPSE